MSKTLIIPSAGLAKRLYPLSQNTPKILIKLNGVPLFHFFYKKAVELQMDNIIIAINPEFKRQLEEFINNTYQNVSIPIHIVEVDDSKAGVLYSIHCATKHSKCKETSLIMLSDTIYNASLPTDQNKSFVIYQQMSGDLTRWCLVETDLFKQIKKFWDKPQGDCPTNQALIGIYYVKTSIFNQITEQIIKKKKKHRNEFQISQALDMYGKKEDLFAIEAEKKAWHDTGTLENLKKTYLNFFISRNFNSIKLEKGNLIKSSLNKSKLRNEYIWFQNVTNKSIIPTIYGYKDYLDKSEIEMSLCSLNDLGTIFNFCNAEKVFFQQTIKYLLEMLDKEFYSKEVRNVPEANYKMLIQKIINRFGSSPFNFDQELIKKFQSEMYKIYNKGIFSQIHGDLILSNILFEPQRMVIKLIDPRGDYGGLGIYGDIRYDLAKLLHSVDGKYETILHNLYTINNNKVIFYMSKEKEECFKSAEEVIFNFAKKKGITSKELKLIEAGLFLSMLPLHKEDKKRQRAFYLIAKKILKEIL